MNNDVNLLHDIGMTFVLIYVVLAVFLCCGGFIFGVLATDKNIHLFENPFSIPWQWLFPMYGICYYITYFLFGGFQHER